MSTRTCRVGIHGRNNPRFEEIDFRVIKEANVEAVKMMSQSEPWVFERIANENPGIEIITRLYDDRIGEGHHPTPQEFAQRMVPIMGTLRPYCTKFQVLNEPNHLHRYEGWGKEDADAEDFNRWFLETLQLLKSAHPWARIGFPGLAVPDGAHRDRAWLRICRPAIQRADWLGVHCYWQTPPNGQSVMLADHSGLAFKYYHEAFPDKTLEILECGNSNGQNPNWPIADDAVAQEYVTWLQEVFKYPYINSAAFYMLSSQDQTWESFAWRTESSFIKPVVHWIRNMNRPARVDVATSPAVAPPAQPPTQPTPTPTPTTPPPAGPSADPPRRLFSNQQVIDAFYAANAGLGLPDWELMGKAGLQLGKLATRRGLAYTGPALDELPQLTPVERNAVWQAFANLSAPVSSEAVSFSLSDEHKPIGRLWKRDDLAIVKPALPREHRLPIESAATPLQRRTAGIWNRYGYLIMRLSDLLAIDQDVITAVLAIQCRRRAFDADRRLVVRFENHVFYHRWGRENAERYKQSYAFNASRPWQKHQWRPAPGEPWQEVHSSQSNEWGAFEQARSLDEEAALMSTSMGLPAIMGFNYGLAGFDSAAQMFDAFRAGGRNQVLGFFDFIGEPTAISRPVMALQARDMETFAALHNGPGMAATNAMRLHAALDACRLLSIGQA